MSDVAESPLAEYARTGSETAFQEVVTRYLNLVHSTAQRLVNGDAHLAEDITQRVFADLAKLAGSLSREVMLGGWLHRHTCFLARNVIRSEQRRQVREHQAFLMNDSDEPSESELAALKPVLDDAVNRLGSADRNALVLRFYEQRNFQAVGEALGSSEEAARKRVNRALDKLRVVLKRRGLSLSIGTLGTALATQAITAAPASLAIGITASALATAAAGGGTALTLLHIMSISKFQAGAIALLALGLGVPLALQQQTVSSLRQQNDALRVEVQRVEALTAENARLSNLVAKAPTGVTPGDRQQSRELLKLRGEIGSLRKTTDEAVAAVEKASEAPLTGITANPEMNKMIRDQQKMALGMVYKGLGPRLNLPAEKMEQLNDLLADQVMTNIAHTTAMLRAGKSVKEMDQVFARLENETHEKVKQLLGAEGLEKYQDYNVNIGSYLTAEQFAGMMLKGDKEAKASQSRKLNDLMRVERENVLAAHGLQPDHQIVPTLNFRNIASEEEGERSLQLLDSIYERVQAGATSFLSPEELEKFGEFRKLAINNNRLALTVNRKLMAPPTK